MKVIPLFTSAYSYKSILTIGPIKKIEEAEQNGADNIIEICKEERINTLFLVEENMASFLQAKNACRNNLKLAYGVRFTFCDNIHDKEPNENSYCKYIIFANNDAGYYKLLDIFTKANTDGYHKIPRLDFMTLKSMWTDDLTLAVPFYDSFIHRNSLYFSECVPNFSFCKPIFFIEENLLFFDEAIKEGVLKYATENGYECVTSKSIYYKRREDFLAWQTYRCIQNRSTLEVPNLEHCASREFCVDSWKEQNHE